ncbi:MAG: acyl-CoA dehydrogenase family protein, partial [Thermodesulfobacteriota bacterium]
MDLDKEREMIRQTAAKTALRIQSKAAEVDATGQFPWDLIEAFGKQGFLSILLPEEYGGTNGDLLSFCLVIEEIAKVCGSSSMMILGQGLGTNPILIAGNSIQKERYFNQISEKNSLIAFALCEPEIGLDLSSIKTRAEKKGNEYFIHGHKAFVINGSAAHLFTVFAITDPHRGKEGVTGFVVERGAQGLRFGEE